MLLHFFNQCFNTCIVYSNIFVVKVLEGYGEVFQSVRWPPKQHSKSFKYGTNFQKYSTKFGLLLRFFEY